MDLRLICERCGIKWFLPSHRKVVEEPMSCAACGGRLIALKAAGGERPVGWPGADAAT